MRKNPLKIQTILIIPTFLFITHCNQKGDKIPLLEINPANNLQVSLQDFQLILLPLERPDSIVFGEPEHIEFVDGHYFIHDPNQTKTLTVFDEAGNFISQLTCKGTGPEEINNIDLFTYNPFKKEVLIHERGKGFTIFNFPDFHFKKAIRIFPYLMSIKAIDGDTYALVVEADEDKSGEVLIVDTNFNETGQPKLDLPIMSAELSYPSTFSRIHSELFYIAPNFDNTFYSISSKNWEALWKVNFGSEGITQNLWKIYNYDNEIEEEITEKNKAAYLHHIAWANDTLFAWFKYRSINDIYFTMIHPASQKTKVFSTLELMREDVGFPYPLGVKEKFFIGIPEDLELLYNNFPDQLKKGSAMSKIDLAIKKNKPVILLYALKH